jgi:hypothetical protein
VFRINTTPTKKDIRGFALVIVIGFGLIAFLLYRSGRTSAAFLLFGTILAAAVLSVALSSSIGRRLYVAWMALGYAIGRVVSPIVMGVIYFALITPVALIFRWTGRDELGLRRSKKTYWKDLAEPPPNDHQHLF